MPPELIWLSTSLFCNKNNWAELLREGIGGFISSTPNLISYSIEFNNLSGENIRMALLTNQSAAPTLSQCADKYFKEYFGSAILTIKPITPPFVGVFMPFPANSIQYGLYPAQIINSNDLKKYQTGIDLSKIMIEALKDEIDDEAILTFAFYLQMGLIRSIYKYLNDIAKIVLITGYFANAGNHLDEDLMSGYIIMDEITVDVMQTESFDPELNWLNSWTTQCTQALKSLGASDIDETILLKQFYANKTAAINKCLGFSIKSKNLVNDLISRSLNRYFAISND